MTGTKVNSIKVSKNMVETNLENGKVIKSEKVLIAIGVRPNIEDLNLEICNIKLDNGWIKVSETMQTNVENIYAIGDVAGPPWLAHVASKEGINAVEHLSSLNPLPIDYKNVPGCTYCDPEVASVGYSENEAKKQGYEVRVGKFPFRALGKSLATGNHEGFVKMVYDVKYGELLGCHIIGPEATNLISEAAIAINLETTYREVLNTIHPHPTLSEAIMEATADAYDEAIHI